MGRWGAGERGGGGSIASEDIIPHCFPDLQGLYISLPTASYEAEATREAPVEAPGPLKPVENGTVDLAKRLEDVHYIAQLGGGFAAG